MKRTMNLSLWCIAMLTATTVLFTSCKKDKSFADNLANDAETEATLNASADDAGDDAIFEDVFDITASMNTNQVGEKLGLGANVSGLFSMGEAPDTLSRCFTITVVPNIPGVFPKTVTIDFGNGCLCRDGKYRKGKIVSIYTNPMEVPGAVVSTTFIDYFVDNLHVEGTHITTNTSTSNMKGWQIKVLDSKITNTNNGKWRKRNSLKDYVQIAGNGTPGYPYDDVLKITGGARGSNSAGHTWATLIIEPLIKKYTCRWISKGTVKILRDGREALLDYGNGECDNKAILYINGRAYPIFL